MYLLSLGPGGRGGGAQAPGAPLVLYADEVYKAAGR